MATFAQSPVVSERHTAPARIVTRGDPGGASPRETGYNLRPNPSLMFDARLQGKRQAENVHFDVDGDGKVTVFLFTQVPPQDLRCVICWELFKDPVITQCGHSFCRHCITQELQQSGRCPNDRRPVNQRDLAPNLLAKTLVEELEVHCTYGCTFTDEGWVLDDEGCPETVKFGLRKAHQRACDFAPVRCPYGGDRCDLVPQIYLEDHMEEECPHNHLARRAEDRHKDSEMDNLEMLTVFVSWSLLMFGLLQTEFAGGLLRQAAGPLTVFIAFPVGVAFIMVIAEYFYNYERQDDDDDKDD